MEIVTKAGDDGWIRHKRRYEKEGSESNIDQRKGGMIKGNGCMWDGEMKMGILSIKRYNASFSQKPGQQPLYPSLRILLQSKHRKPRVMTLNNR